MNEKNLIFVINAAYIGQFKVTFRSLAERNAASSFSVHLLYSALTEENRADLERFVSALGSRMFFYEIDESVFAGLPKMGYDNAYTAYHKVLIPYVLSHLERALYLDCDIVVRDDLTPLFEMPTGTLISAVNDEKVNKNHRDHVKRLTGSEDIPYFNSGVMLFDFTHRERIVPEEELLTYLREHLSEIRWHDQDILNHFYAKDDCTILDAKYNYVTTYRSVADALFPLGRRSAVIVHYANWKPWNANYIGKFYRLYRKAYRACAGEAGVSFLKKRTPAAQFKLIWKYLTKR